LREIEIPSGIELIGESCFFECKSLQKCSFESGSSLKEIGRCAFLDTSLTEIVVPGKCEVFGDHSLGHIRKVSFCGESPLFTVCQTGIKSSDGKKLVTSFGSEEKIVIDNEIEFMFDHCFGQCPDLYLPSYHRRKAVNQPHPRHEITFECESRLKCLGKSALGTTLLKTIQIPSSVEVIEKSCFDQCQSLCEVTFESQSKLRRIEQYAFHATALETIQIPSSTESIGKGCFYFCESLWEIVFESGSELKFIGGCAFTATSLRNIEIPDCVQSIGEYCFNGCKFLSIRTLNDCLTNSK
jgi:hypothetical protein